MRLLAVIRRHWEGLLAAALFIAAVYAAVDQILDGAYGIAGFLLMCALGFLWVCNSIAEAAAYERLKEQGARRDRKGQ